MNKVFSLVVALFAIYFITVSVRSDIILPPPGGGGGSGSGSITNLPSYALTNNQSSQVTLLGGQTNSGKLDIGGAGFFTGNITSKTTTARMVVEGTISAGVRIAQGANVISFDTTAGPNISSVDGANGDQFMLWNGSVISLITSPTGTVSYGHFFTPSNATAANFVATADDAYAAGWNGSLGIPTKNALYDKIETLGGGSGGTNFPAVLAQLGNTNLTLQAGKRTTHYFATNGNHGIDADLAAPASGHSFINIETNSAATNYTVTFYTNGTAATFYDIEEKTNNSTWTVPAGAIVETEFTWTGSQWLFKREAPAAVLSAGYKMELTTGGVNGLTITAQTTQRYTNYATGALSINCATDVNANITNAVASNYAITLATPVIGTSGSLGLVSDGSARTLAILSPSAAITWMSTNDTATATNILTTASKRSLFAWRVGMATDGVSTNIHCWVKNQTP